MVSLEINEPLAGIKKWTGRSGPVENCLEGKIDEVAINPQKKQKKKKRKLHILSPW